MGNHAKVFLVPYFFLAYFASLKVYRVCVTQCVNRHGHSHTILHLLGVFESFLFSVIINITSLSPSVVCVSSKTYLHSSNGALRSLSGCLHTLGTSRARPKSHYPQCVCGWYVNYICSLATPLRPMRLRSVAHPLCPCCLYGG